MALEASGAGGYSGVPMREIDAGEIVEKIQKGEPVEYDHVVVRGDLDLSRERLRKNITSPISFVDSIFDGKIDFSYSILEMPVVLYGSNFTRDVYFSGATFSGDAGFGGATFSGVAYFERATFRSDASFEGSDFSGVANFVEATFSGDADFWGAIFSGDCDFGETTFGGTTYFGRATFSGTAYFGGATFSGIAYFGGATFNGYLHFEDSAFNGIVYFEGSAFNGPTFFFSTDFNINADFVWATFSGNANFEMATFNGYTLFFGTTFKGNSNFERAEFDGNIEFDDARFENDTSFYRILFKRPAYFENCYMSSLNLTKAEYSRLHLHWDDITSLHFDEAAYLALIKNYNNLGWYGDANDCYYAYRNAVRENWQAPSSGFAASLSNLLDRLIDFGEWLLYGYGVRPTFPVAWSVGIILAFGIFFRQKRCLRKIIIEERIEDSKDKSDEVLVKTTARKAEINALDPILFSLFTFTSGFTSFLHPTIEYKLERCVRWAIFERLLGPFFMALVITAISKTYLIR